MSRVSKLLDTIALRRQRERETADALFVPIIRARVLKAAPVNDLEVPITVDGKLTTLLIPAEQPDHTLAADMLAAMPLLMADALRNTPIPRIERSIHTRKAPEAKSLYSPVKRHFKFKTKTGEYRWQDDNIQN